VILGSRVKVAKHGTLDLDTRRGSWTIGGACESGSKEDEMHVAIYARVSTTRQAENELSIPDQLRQLDEWATSNGHLVVQEYVEAGASATDDRRPVFQQMISDAMLKPSPFEAILIHSLSRFFRDGIEFGIYERKLIKNKVSVISITQPTSDDSGGQMMRRIINLFDEHQSKENSKHVKRAMRENARQGFFNGAVAPFGYQSITTDIPGSRGRKRKKLAINESESGVLTMIFEMYLNGLEGQQMGCKEIAQYLTKKGLLFRGKPWSMQQVHKVLANTVCMGEYFSNQRDWKTKEPTPPTEWIKSNVPPIIDAALFEQVREKRESRSPSNSLPRVTSSPTLLTGLLKCACGASMTITTGKGGRYKYYKCTSRQSRGNYACPSVSLSMSKVDALVLSHMTETILAPDHLKKLMAQLQVSLKDSRQIQQNRVNEINKQIKQTEARQSRLLEAIETGTIALDDITAKRAQGLKASREALFVELARVRRESAMPSTRIFKPEQVEIFRQVLREKLQDPTSPFAKSYLNILVDEIVVNKDQATMKGRHLALVDAAQKSSSISGGEVPTFIMDWCARRCSVP
jgi:DNA invertase Pin-like site-specific DNA recombinase